MNNEQTIITVKRNRLWYLIIPIVVLFYYSWRFGLDAEILLGFALLLVMILFIISRQSRTITFYNDKLVIDYTWIYSSKTIKYSDIEFMKEFSGGYMTEGGLKFKLKSGKNIIIECQSELKKIADLLGEQDIKIKSE